MKESVLFLILFLQEGECVYGLSDRFTSFVKMDVLSCHQV